MRTLALLVVVECIVCLFGTVATEKVVSVQGHKIVKRGILGLGLAIECDLHHPSFLHIWAASRYGTYGCYCGPGGSGPTLDDIDRCCKDHDRCYDKFEDKYDKNYFDSYKSHCTADGIVCDSKDNARLQFICDCDRKFAACLRVLQQKYNESLKNVRSTLCNQPPKD